MSIIDTKNSGKTLILIFQVNNFGDEGGRLEVGSPTSLFLEGRSYRKLRESNLVKRRDRVHKFGHLKK